MGLRRGHGPVSSRRPDDSLSSRAGGGRRRVSLTPLPNLASGPLHSFVLLLRQCVHVPKGKKKKKIDRQCDNLLPLQGRNG